MQRIAVICDDELLFRRIKAELSSDYECIKSDGTALLSSDIVIAEAGADVSALVTPDILLSYPDTLPLACGDIAGLLAKVSKKPRLILSEASLACTLDGRKIRLTELEYRLLSLLLSRGGEFFKKDELCSLLFSREDLGMLNLYIHYLRNKLEAEGERIIISKRGLGYKINEKFITGGSVC